MLVVLLVDSTHVGGNVITLGGGCDQHLLGSGLLHSIAAGEDTQGSRFKGCSGQEPLRALNTGLKPLKTGFRGYSVKATQDRLVEGTQDRLERLLKTGSRNYSAQVLTNVKRGTSCHGRQTERCKRCF